MWRQRIARRAHAARDRGLDELAPPQRQRLPAHDARHREPADRADRDEQRVEVAAREASSSRMMTMKMYGSA